MNTIDSLDARRLPREATGRRAPEIWGMAALVVIESTVFAALVASYFHLRTRAESWPPAGTPMPELLLPSLATASIVASVVPVYLAERGIREGRSMRSWVLLPAGMLFLLGYMGITAYEYLTLDYTWRSHAYGSIVWTMTGLHLAHASAVLLFALAVWVLTFSTEIDARRQVAVQVNALYWYFAAATSIVVYVVLYLSPRLI